MAIQLRMLEVFTSCDSFHNAADPAGSRKDAATVTVYLVRNGEHFFFLKTFLFSADFRLKIFCVLFLNYSSLHSVLEYMGVSIVVIAGFFVLLACFAV